MDNFRYVMAACLFLVGVQMLPVAHATSLYSADRYKSLVADHRAHRVGDTITLVIVENASAKAQTDSALDQSFGLDAGMDITQRSEDADIKIGMQRDSGGSTARTGSVRAQMTATVQEVDSQNRLFVAGEQKITINGEAQGISISGWLRPEDINDKNVSISTRLAESKIIYVGVGDPNDTNKPGWIYKFFSFIGLI